MPAPDDFTVTLLHAIQNERTTPQGGWLTLREMARGMHLKAVDAQHLYGPLKELFDAGMIERRFNARTAQDEYRSRGVQPAMGHDYGDAKGPNLRAPRHPNDDFADAIKGLIFADAIRDPTKASAAPPVEDDAVVEEHMARRLLNVLMTTGREEWFADGDLMHALDTEDLGTVWSGLNLLEAAGLIQRRPDGKAIRLHLDLRRWS